MMKPKYLIVVALGLSHLVSANEFKIPPPVGLLLLPHPKVYDVSPQRAEHGMMNYCYETKNGYTVYSKSTVGEGYLFSTVKPQEKCYKSSEAISSTNNLRLTIGSSVQDAEAAIGLKLNEGINIVSWHYQRPIKNNPFDDLTTLKISIKNNQVNSISVFNTVTN